MRIVITGICGSVGRRVTSHLAARDDVSLVGVDVKAPTGMDEMPIEMHVGDLRTMDLSDALNKADVVVHLASAFVPSRDFTDVGPLDTAATQAVLNAAAKAGVAHLVLLSSAMVYGAWPNNPLPLTEQAPTRPNPGFSFAVHKLKIEELGEAWRRRTAGGSLTVLRPTTALASGDSSWVARTMRIAAGLAADNAPPLQFLHLDDLAAAVCLAAEQRLEGIFNVAPDGWASGEEVRQLTGRLPRLRLPTNVAGNLAEAGWRHRVAPTPPGIVPYTSQPWVVANDRLRAAGWEPGYSNVEAYVVGHTARPWAMISAKRRQELALGVAGGAMAVGIGVASVVSRRWRR